MRSEIAAENRTAANSYLDDGLDIDLAAMQQKVDKSSKPEKIGENIFLILAFPCLVIVAINKDWVMLLWVITSISFCLEKRKWRKEVSKKYDLLFKALTLIDAQRNLINHFDTNYTPNFLEKRH